MPRGQDVLPWGFDRERVCVFSPVWDSGLSRAAVGSVRNPDGNWYADTYVVSSKLLRPGRPHSDCFRLLQSFIQEYNIGSDEEPAYDPGKVAEYRHEEHVQKRRAK